jgi:hypothetical protein
MSDAIPRALRERVADSRPDLPVHVSFGPDHSRQVVRMVPAAGRPLVPRVVEIARCLEGER